jgi:Ca-activated chloride channel family protein
MRFFWEHLFGYVVLVGGALLVLGLIESRIPGELLSLELVHPWALLLLLAVPLLSYVGFHAAARRRGALLFSRVRDLRAVGPGLGARLRKIPPALRILALALFVVALGRPQSHLTIRHAEQVEGIDIVLALDVSRSMQARDLSGQIFGGKTRLDVAKEVIDEFIRRREHDRIGLVLFGREAYTWCPPTLDYQALRTLLSEVKLGIINGRATAIGDAVGTAINRLRHSEASSKVIILLTDGENNAGLITPNQAANYAATFKIKVFTILMGKNVGGGHRGLLGRRGARVNPRLLEQIATITGGTPYLATDRQALRERFQRILDTLKKDVRVRKERRPSEHWRLFAVSGLLLLLLELFLRLAVLRRFP